MDYRVTELIAKEQEKGAKLEYIACGARTRYTQVGGSLGSVSVSARLRLRGLFKLQ